MSALMAAFARVGGVYGLRGHALRPLAEHEVEAIEQVLAAPLPCLYREFLLTFGTVGFNQIVECTMLDPLPGDVALASTAEVMVMFGAGTHDDAVYSVLWNIYIYRDRMPETMFPIGDDVFGNRLCLGFAGDEYNKVYFWDHEDEWDDLYYIERGEPVPPRLKFRNLYLIANSFEDFINCLEVCEYEEE